jgi:signal transduction histidine kinase
MHLYYQSHLAKIKKKEAELLLKTALKSEKKERTRIAKDLHDGIQSDLNSVRNYLILFSKKNSHTNSPELLEAIRTSLEQTIENTRLITFQMMPPLLETAGFNFTLRNYFDQLNSSSGSQFEQIYSLTDVQVPDTIAYELFRVIQELTSNMLKHGFVLKCTADLTVLGSEFCFTLEDNGLPFDFYYFYKLNKGNGLQNIQSRLKSISGRLEQKSLTTGNNYLIYIPFND